MNATQVAQKVVVVARGAASVARVVGGAVGVAGEVAGAVAEILAPTLVKRVRAARLRIVDRRKRTARAEAGGPT